MSSDNERKEEEKVKEESKVLAQIGEDSGAVIESKPKSTNDKQIAGEGDPTRSDE